MLCIVLAMVGILEELFFVEAVDTIVFWVVLLRA